MLLFPNIILALIPLFLWYCGIVFISPFISRIIGSLLTILFTCGASDYSLFFDTVLCTKKEDNIIIFKNEFILHIMQSDIERARIEIKNNSDMLNNCISELRNIIFEEDNLIKIGETLN